MRWTLGLVIVTCLGCSEAPSSVTPTPPPVEYSLAGSASDTAFRALPDVRIEVIDGPRAGTFAVTDASGQYQLPGTFSNTKQIDVRGTKDGYVTVDQYYQTMYAGLQFLPFQMQLNAGAANIAGDYTLAFTADACPNLPAAARTRTYLATITPSSSPQHDAYQAALSGASFYPSANRLYIGVAGTIARFMLSPWDTGVVVTEELAPQTYLSIYGTADLSVTASGVSASTISGSLDGTFEYCESPTPVTGNLYGCPVTPITCASTNHRVTFVRR